MRQRFLRNLGPFFFRIMRRETETLGGVVHQQVYRVILAVDAVDSVERHPLRFKACADACEHRAQVVWNFFCEYVTAVFRYE